jgi:hypothetical protein
VLNITPSDGSRLGLPASPLAAFALRSSTTSTLKPQLFTPDSLCLQPRTTKSISTPVFPSYLICFSTILVLITSHLVRLERITAKHDRIYWVSMYAPLVPQKLMLTLGFHLGHASRWCQEATFGMWQWPCVLDFPTVLIVFVVTSAHCTRLARRIQLSLLNRSRLMAQKAVAQIQRMKSQLLTVSTSTLSSEVVM